jgi:hypothetical protein
VNDRRQAKPGLRKLCSKSMDPGFSSNEPQKTETATLNAPSMISTNHQIHNRTLGQTLCVWSFFILKAGTWLGAIAVLILGREFKKQELGFLAWPLVTVYLASFFYAMTYLVFNECSGRFIRWLWLLTLALIVVVLVANAASFLMNA